MLGLLKKLFGSKEQPVQPEVPYKVEAPATVVETKATEAMVASIPATPVEAVKKPRAKKPAAPKQEAAPKKTTGTRKPKAKV